MNVLMFSPGFPAEMPYFTRGLAQVGARVIGLGDQPEGALPDMARRALSAHVQVGGFSDENAVLERIEEIARQAQVDRIECLWEPLMILAARARERLGIPGMTVEQTIPFRDKEVMKSKLDAAGIRTPRHASATSVGGVLEAAERIGYPLIVKPIAGAGSKDTYRIESRAELDNVLPKLGHITEVSVEEFVEGEDFTFDTICADGQVLYHNIAFYRPRALVSQSVEWVSPQTVCVREVDSPALAQGSAMGLSVLKALGFQTGFTHMEWYRKPDGEAVFGEIGARPAGARTVDVMNFASDVDLFRGWAEAVCHGHLSQPIERRYNAAAIFKRAQGQGCIQRIEGLQRCMAEFGDSIAVVELSPVGTPRKNWRQSLTGDGFVVVRHADLDLALHLADRIATEVQIFAG